MLIQQITNPNKNNPKQKNTKTKKKEKRKRRKEKRKRKKKDRGSLFPKDIETINNREITFIPLNNNEFCLLSIYPP